MFESRISVITDRLEKYGNVEVKQLCREFGVTEKTIRSDLSKMEKKGLLKRVHGGAVSNIKQAEDAYLNRDRMISLHSKELIAHLAFDYVSSLSAIGQVFFIDAGTTNYEFARTLRNMNHTIITNDLLIASKLSPMVGAVHITGGRIDNDINKYLVGPDAIEMINRHSANICFLGTSSFSISNGLMTHTNEDAEVKRAMMNHSGTIICLADHSKYETTSFVKYADISELDILITDQATAEEKEAFEKLGVKLISISE
jgi:DeoR/GlpR family transcriptional regulator of sugar metabolism